MGVAKDVLGTLYQGGEGFMAKARAKDTRTEADWRGFYRLLAIGRARRLGILPTPPEVLERLQREEEQRKAECPREAG